jgi:hypothetical protein
MFATQPNFLRPELFFVTQPLIATSDVSKTLISFQKFLEYRQWTAVLKAIRKQAVYHFGQCPRLSPFEVYVPDFDIVIPAYGNYSQGTFTLKAACLTSSV